MFSWPCGGLLSLSQGSWNEFLGAVKAKAYLSSVPSGLLLSLPESQAMAFPGQWQCSGIHSLKDVVYWCLLWLVTTDCSHGFFPTLRVVTSHW